MTSALLIDESARLRTDAGLVRRDSWSWVLATGADREAYLHRMTSQVVSGLAPGGVAYACVLTPKGKVLGDPLIWNLGAALALDQDARARDESLPALERYVIADDVAFEDRSAEVARFVLIGPAAAACLERAGFPPPTEGVFTEVEVEGLQARVLRRDLGSRPAFEWVVPAEAAGALVGRLAAVEVSHEAYDVLRVEERIPAYGHELGVETMPLEARLENVAVAFGKGCYPGQEPVVMAHHRGKPANLLVQVALVGAVEAAAFATLSRDGRAVGRLTTVAPFGAEGGPLALAFVRHALAEGGELVDVDGGGQARVLATPTSGEGGP